MEKISIIIPVYNGSKNLERCLDSIIKQDYRDLEIIVVDDGSKDNSFEIISDYALKDERIIPVHKKNGGVSSTRNKGLDIATGDYIQFVDVDDWLVFDASKLLIRAMKENDVDLVVADFYRVIGDKTSQKGPFKTNRLFTRNEYADKMMLSPADFYYGVLWNKLYKKSIIDRHHLRMDESIDYCEDTIFNLEYLLHVDNVYVLTSPVYYYQFSEGSLVTQNLNIKDTVKMKTEVIKYYDNFYRNIMDPYEYEQRKPIIYSFLFAFSKDALNIPLMDSVKKLGEEKTGRVYLNEIIDSDSQLMFDYLTDNMLKQLLNAVALQHNLELNDLIILYYLYLKGKAASFDEIMSICNIKYSNLALSLTKLIALSYIRITDLSLTNEDLMKYEYVSGKLDNDLRQINIDYENVCFKDLDKQEIETFKKIKSKIINNISETIKD